MSDLVLITNEFDLAGVEYYTLKFTEMIGVSIAENMDGFYLDGSVNPSISDS